MSKRRIRVGLVFGGQSSEHEVSISSARSVIDALENSSYDLQLMGISKDGSWYVGADAWDCLFFRSDRALLPKSIQHEPKVDSHLSSFECFPGFPPYETFRELDCIFPLVLGATGEDGALQGFCRFVGKPIVGCGVLSSALAFDKWATKQHVKAAGIPVAKAIRVDQSENFDAIETNRPAFYAPRPAPRRLGPPCQPEPDGRLRPRRECGGNRRRGLSPAGGAAARRGVRAA